MSKPSPKYTMSKRKMDIILRDGCGGQFDIVAGKFVCQHEYEWTCEHCPTKRITNGTEDRQPL